MKSGSWRMGSAISTQALIDAAEESVTNIGELSSKS
jgi:hypothetical protein